MNTWAAYGIGIATGFGYGMLAWPIGKWVFKGA